jgi:predicted RNase H-like HicB family nuclease
MTTANIVTISDTDAWKQYAGVYRCQVFVAKLDDGTFLATAAQLANVSAHGANEAESLTNITAAIVVAIQKLRTNEGVPWVSPPDSPPAGAVVRWVFADTRNAS